MNVAVLICTYGSDDWRQRGQEAFENHRDCVADVVAHHTSEGSVAATRNMAAEKVSNDWLCFLDADDCLAPGYLDAMEKAAPPSVPVHASDGNLENYMTWREDDEDEEQACARDRELIAQMRQEYIECTSEVQHMVDLMPKQLLAPAVSYDGGKTAALPNRHQPMTAMNHCVIGTLIPRELFLQVGGFDERWPIYEDWALFLACVRAGARIVDVPDAVYLDRHVPGGRNTPTPAMSETYYAIRLEHERGRA